MRKRRWLFLAAVVLVGAIVSTRLPDLQRPRDGNPVPFTSLDKTLASEIKNGWTVSVPPKREGPYRQIPGATASEGASRRIIDRDGTTEEIKLESSANEHQKIIELETENSHRTLVALKRPK